MKTEAGVGLAGSGILDVGSSVLLMGDFFLAFDGFLTVAATVTVCSMD